MKLIILTGISGSGKSTAKFVFEELGFYIVDNAPSGSTKSILDTLSSSDLHNPSGICLMPHLRNSNIVYDVAKNDSRFETSLICLECEKEVIYQRYTLSRHMHPRAVLEHISFLEAVDRDYADLENIKDKADLVVNTTSLSPKQLRQILYNHLEGRKSDNLTQVVFQSFGLKHGVPRDIDCIFDVRTIPNPYWVRSLAPLTGLDKPVIDYMLSFPETRVLIDNIVRYLEIHLAEVQKSKRGNYVVGIACSGGQHRSTYVADYLSKYFADKYKTLVIHRDCFVLKEKE